MKVPPYFPSETRVHGNQRRSRRRGVTLVYVTLMMGAIFGLVSLGVDMGRVQVAKMELRRATDAAARAAGSGLGNYVTAQNLAVQYAAANTVDGAPLVLSTAAGSTDIQFGTWDSTTRTFTPLSQGVWNSANAVKINAQRTTANGNPISLLFGSAVGMPTCDISASAVVCESGGYGLVGLNYISINGNSTASYWSANGNLGGGQGNVASNGSITSSGHSTINGTIWHQSGQTISGVSANQIQLLTTPLSYSNGNCAPYNGVNNDDQKITPANTVNGVPDLSIGSGVTATIPAGNYVFRNVTISGTANFTGPATIYYYGSVSITGHALTNGNIPKNLTIVACNDPSKGNPPGSMTISGNSTLYATIYAPQSDITMSGTGDIYGSVLGKSITMSGTSNIYYDLSLPGGGGIQLVQ